MIVLIRRSRIIIVDVHLKLVKSRIEKGYSILFDLPFEMRFIHLLLHTSSIYHVINNSFPPGSVSNIFFKNLNLNHKVLLLKRLKDDCTVERDCRCASLIRRS